MQKILKFFEILVLKREFWVDYKSLFFLKICFKNKFCAVKRVVF